MVRIISLTRNLTTFLVGGFGSMRKINALYDQMEETAGGMPQGLWYAYVLAPLSKSFGLLNFAFLKGSWDHHPTRAFDRAN